MRIDVHTHIVPPGWEDWAAKYGGGRWPRLVQRDACRATIMTGDQFFRDVDDRSWSPARRREDMDRLGVDRQVLSPPPVMFCYWADAKAARAFCRLQNENVAAIAAADPARFAGMATVPLQDPGLAIEELRQARERLGLRAVEIGTWSACRTSGSASPTGAARSRSRWRGSTTAGRCARRGRPRSPGVRSSTPGSFGSTRSRSRARTCASSSRSSAVRAS